LIDQAVTNEGGFTGLARPQHGRHRVGFSPRCAIPIACPFAFITDVDGAVVPVEVKSGWVTQAKSLRSFADKYKPAFSAVFSGRNAGSDRSLARHYYPLYLASKFPLPVRA
jgi:hypothetical protein